MDNLIDDFLILAMVLSFAACGKEEDSPKEGKDRDTDKTVTGTPTAEPTGEPTGEPTPEPTGEATPTPTPTESPKPTEILNDDEVYVADQRNERRIKRLFGRSKQHSERRPFGNGCGCRSETVCSVQGKHG